MGLDGLNWKEPEPFVHGERAATFLHAQEGAYVPGIQGRSPRPSDRDRPPKSLCPTTGLRIGEVLGLKWSDVSFADQTLNVCRSFADGTIGPCKTEISHQPVPLDRSALKQLRDWRPVCAYPRDEDWISPATRNSARFASGPIVSGRKSSSRSPEKRGPRRGSVGTFRHTYSSLLAHTGNDMRAVQELMRHAKVNTTMEIYTHVAMDKKRVAQQQTVDHLLSRDKDGTTVRPYVPKLLPET